jgi:hypothetical protein
VDPSIACLDAVFANMLLCAGDLNLIEVRAVTGHRQSDANRSERSQILYVHGAAQAASKIESTTEARSYTEEPFRIEKQNQNPRAKPRTRRKAGEHGQGKTLRKFLRGLKSKKCTAPNAVRPESDANVSLWNKKRQVLMTIFRRLWHTHTLNTSQFLCEFSFTP